MENVYSHEVFEEYMRRFSAFGQAWSSGVIPEYFLGKVVGASQRHSVLLPLCAYLPADLAASALHIWMHLDAHACTWACATFSLHCLDAIIAVACFQPIVAARLEDRQTPVNGCDGHLLQYCQMIRFPPVCAADASRD